MLVTEVGLQPTQLGTVEEAQAALVRFDVVMLEHVLTQILVAGARECALMTAKNNILQVLGQLWPTHLYGNHTLLCNWTKKISECSLVRV